MISEKQLIEIREHLDKATNPLFFFDDDPDGLTSFLLLKRKYKKGGCVPMKTTFATEAFYLPKIAEYKPDKVFLLDKPVVSQEILDHIDVPVIWIDHHQPLTFPDSPHINYYNPMTTTPGDNTCTSNICYNVVRQDEWLALIGIISDWQAPSFIKDFTYKDLLDNKTTAPEIFFESQYGTLVKFFTFLLKGDYEDVKKSIGILETVQSPRDLLNPTTPETRYLYSRFEVYNKEYGQLYQDAFSQKHDENLFVYTYAATKTSFTGLLSNELLYFILEVFF